MGIDDDRDLSFAMIQIQLEDRSRAHAGVDI